MNPTQLLRIALFVLIPIIALVVSLQIADSSILLPFLLVFGTLMVAFTAAYPAILLVLCIVFSGLTGRSGLGLGYWEIFSCALMARWGLEAVFSGSLFGTVKGKFTFVCILGYTGILAWHGLPALLSVGDGVGRRLAIMAIAGAGISYLLLAQRVNLSRLKWLPWVGLIPGIVLSTFDLVNLLIPSALPITYFIYEGQNWEIIAQYLGESGGMVRIAGFRDLGLGFALLALTYFGFQKTFRPGRLTIQTLVTIVGAAFVAFAGYRNFVIRIAAGVLIASYARSKATFIAVCITATLFVGALLFVQSNVVTLPLTVQRSLSFLPGDWDAATKFEADSGLEWRSEIRSIFFQQIFPNHMLLGRGLVYDERIASMTWMAQSPDFQTEYFVLMQSYHSGLASSLDFVGIIGTAFLILGSLRAIWNCTFVIRRIADAQPWHLWSVLMLLPTIPLFWYTSFFERTFPFLTVFFCLLEIARSQITEGTGEAPITDREEADYEMELATR